MANTKLGKKDIFAGTEASTAAKLPRMKSPPHVGSSVENKVTVILPPDQVDYLDNLALTIRRNTRSKIRRTEIIRGLIAALQASRVDLSQAASEDEIRRTVLRQLIAASE